MVGRLIASFTTWFTAMVIAWLPDVMGLIQDLSIVVGAVAGIVALLSACQLLKKRKLEIEHLRLENIKLTKECKDEIN